MPCHVDPIEPSVERNEISTAVEIMDGDIKVTYLGLPFPTVSSYLANLRYRLEGATFHYRVAGTMIVVVSPCPKGC